MAAKILVADDSLTIQKVISITLKNLKYEIDECLNESDLIQKIKNNTYSLILLDFNLSNARTGYDLIRQTATISAGTPILVMLGTFDNINENAIFEAGAVDKIVKPFDGQKFIELCKNLTSTQKISSNVGEGEVEISSASEISENENGDEEEVNPAHEVTKEFKIDQSLSRESDKIEEESEDWHVTHEQIAVSTDKKNTGLAGSMIKADKDNQLSKELEDWGMSIPGIIGESGSGSQEVPSRVSPVKKSKIDAATLVYPKEEDLDFPDLEAHSRGLSDKVESIPAISSAPKLVPMSDLVEDFDEEDSSLRPLSLDIKSKPNEALEKEILSEMGQEDLWQADEIIESNKLDLSKTSTQETNAKIVPKIESTTQEASKKFEMNEELIEKLKTSLAPVLEQFVKDYCKQTIEKIAWEVIPDLAENLIKKEIEEISKEI